MGPGQETMERENRETGLSHLLGDTDSAFIDCACTEGPEPGASLGGKAPKGLGAPRRRRRMHSPPNRAGSAMTHLQDRKPNPFSPWRIFHPSTLVNLLLESSIFLESVLIKLSSVFPAMNTN